MTGSNAARALVNDDFLHDGVAIKLSPSRGRIVKFHDVRVEYYGLGDAPVSEDPADVLRLDRETARALFEQLGHYFGGHPDTASLRQDYEHERGRVDKFIDMMIAGVEANTPQPIPPPPTRIK